MPTRLFREGIVDSPRVNALSWGAECFYKRLLNKAEDFGRYIADPVLLRSYLYGRKIDKHGNPAVTLEDIRGWLAECTSRDGLRPGESPLLTVYTVDGQDYIHIDKYGQQIRAKNARYPEPPAHALHVQTDAKHVKTDAKHVCTKTDSESNAKTEAEAGTLPAFPDFLEPADPGPSKPGEAERTRWFENEFWPIVWAKIGVGDARKSWLVKVKTRADADAVIAAAIRQGPEILRRGQANDGRVLHPATWLNQERYKDEVPAAKGVSGAWSYPALKPLAGAE